VVDSRNTGRPGYEVTPAPARRSPGDGAVSPSARNRLEYRARQKEAVARLSMTALQCRDLQQFFESVCQTVTETLSVEYCKVLELMPEGDRLLLRAGVGWGRGYVGRATVGTNLESQAGYTLISSGPVIVDDLAKEIRFKGAPLLHDHGVVSGVTVAIRVGGHFFGVLGTHTSARRTFAEHEVLFLEEMGDLLGAAIERQREEEQSVQTAAEQFERAEAAERRFEFLAEANALLLASSTDYATTLWNTVRLAVPTLADWCFLDVVESGGEILRAAAGRAGGLSGGSPEAEKSLKHGYLIDPSLPHGTPRVLRTGRPEVHDDLDSATLEAVAADPEHLDFLLRIGARSYMCVPLRTRRGRTGAIGFARGGGGGYSDEDLACAEGLAHCTALALDNAAGHLPEVDMAREIIRLSNAAGGEAAALSVPEGEAQNLTRRQLEVLGLMAEGKSARHIGAELYISEDTVRNHIRAIKHALDARSQLEVIARARRLGVLPR